MKLINGLLSKASSKDFIEFNEAFNTALKEHENYSLFIKYLRFRYYDCYDMQLFINSLTSKDELEKTAVYLRKEIELENTLNKLYGPFLSGNDNDDLSSLTNNKMEIIEKIIESSDLDNNKMNQLIRQANVNNVYDLYESLYIPSLVKKGLKNTPTKRVETDEEYILWNYSLLRHEQDGRKHIDVSKYDKSLYKEMIETYKKDEIIDKNEPNDIKDIIKESNFINKKYVVKDFEDKLKGAIIGRFIGCMLGAPVENWSVSNMEEFAKITNTPFPPTQYWNDVKDKEGLHYKKDKKQGFAKDKMTCVIADDDVTYTVLNALVIDKYSKDFSSKQLCEFWNEHVPYACTAEYETMIGLRQDKEYVDIVNNNPYVELIGAAIRADAFAYVCPGDPYNAALLAYKDAVISHKRNGIYGEMFLAATIAYSFVCSNPLEAIKMGLNYIPKNSRLAKDILWALSFENENLDYKRANELITDRFKYMNRVHTNNNMCAIVFSFIIGGIDFDKVISNCIAIGYDNDCTGASVGSILGAIISINSIDEKWYKPFNDTIHTYIRGYEEIKISTLIDIIRRNV